MSDQKYCALRFVCACTLFDRTYRAGRTCLARILGITSDRLYVILSYEVCVQKSASCDASPRFKQSCVSCPVGQHTNSGLCLLGTARKVQGYTPVYANHGSPNLSSKLHSSKFLYNSMKKGINILIIYA
jgi:hypothetical protein